MQTKLERLAESYLDHIRIAVQADDRGAPFRTFLDCWFAFSSMDPHHRSSGDRQRWFNNPHLWDRREMLTTLPFRSQAAADLLTRAVADRGEYGRRRAAKDTAVRVVVDHAVHVAEIVRRIFKQGDSLTLTWLGDYLIHNYRLGLITYEEDRRLNEMGLNNKMPDGWDGANLFARYEVAMIPRAPQ